MEWKITKLQLILLSLLTVCLFGRILTDVSAQTLNTLVKGRTYEIARTPNEKPLCPQTSRDSVISQNLGVQRVTPGGATETHSPSATNVAKSSATTTSGEDKSNEECPPMKPSETSATKIKVGTGRYPDVIDTSWSKESIKDLVSRSKHPKTIEKLVECESGGVPIKRIDSNGLYSYGILQYQSSTWNGWKKQSGIQGEAMEPQAAIRMADWAIDNGFLSRWSCAYITHLL